MGALTTLRFFIRRKNREDVTICMSVDKYLPLHRSEIAGRQRHEAPRLRVSEFNNHGSNAVWFDPDQ
jgi:hypothetical protein